MRPSATPGPSSTCCNTSKSHVERLRSARACEKETHIHSRAGATDNAAGRCRIDGRTFHKKVALTGCRERSAIFRSNQLISAHKEGAYFEHVHEKSIRAERRDSARSMRPRQYLEVVQDRSTRIGSRRKVVPGKNVIQPKQSACKKAFFPDRLPNGSSG